MDADGHHDHERYASTRRPGQDKLTAEQALAALVDALAYANRDRVKDGWTLNIEQALYDSVKVLARLTPDCPIPHADREPRKAKAILDAWVKAQHRQAA